MGGREGGREGTRQDVFVGGRTWRVCGGWPLEAPDRTLPLESGSSYVWHKHCKQAYESPPGEKKIVPGWRGHGDPFPKPPRPCPLCREGGFGRGGCLPAVPEGGGGWIPTYMAQNDPHVVLYGGPPQQAIRRLPPTFLSLSGRWGGGWVRGGAGAGRRGGGGGSQTPTCMA